MPGRTFSIVIWFSLGIGSRRGRLAREEGVTRRWQFVTTVEKVQLEDHYETEKLPSKFLNQLTGCCSRPTGSDYVIHDKNLLTLLDCVALYLEMICPVLLFEGCGVGGTRQLPLLPDRCESCA